MKKLHNVKVIVPRGLGPTRDAYRAFCSYCGPFGPTCDNRADAQAIADRHDEVQGFER